MSMIVAENSVALSDRLKELRRSVGLSQEMLAYKAGVAVSVVHKLEQGRVDDPQWSTMAKLARALGASLDDLAASMEEAVDPAPPTPKRGRPKKGE